MTNTFFKSEEIDDAEMVADLHMIVSELARIGKALKNRGIEFSLLTYEDGDAKASHVEKVTRVKL